MVGELEVAIRLTLSCILGGIIGYERQASNKSAGLRTHILVCLGSCMIMVLSYDIYHEVQGLTNADPARLAAQVVSGIGFLGAGTIMKEGLTIRGLTTAASLWVVSGVGLGVGSGHYTSALITTGLVWLTLTVLPRIEKMFNKKNPVNFTITVIDQPGQLSRIESCLNAAGASIRDIKVEEAHDGLIALGVRLRSLDKINVSDTLSQLMRIDGVRNIKQESF